MTNKPDLAPGCFGSAFYFGKHEVCSVCKFGADCEIQHVRAKEALRAHFGVKVVEKRDKAELPVRVKAVFDELGVSAQSVKEALMSGMNPYLNKRGFMRIVCHLLIKKPSMTRGLMAQYLTKVEDLNLNETTADIYTRYAIQILAYCGAITTDGKTIELVRG